MFKLMFLLFFSLALDGFVPLHSVFPCVPFSAFFTNKPGVMDLDHMISPLIFGCKCYKQYGHREVCMDDPLWPDLLSGFGLTGTLRWFDYVLLILTGRLANVQSGSGDGVGVVRDESESGDEELKSGDEAVTRALWYFT